MRRNGRRIVRERCSGDGREAWGNTSFDFLSDDDFGLDLEFAGADEVGGGGKYGTVCVARVILLWNRGSD